ncbi:hypothetical protein AVEN_78890-1 [Araneus ventricosus]|uniref:Uncharacterized protein n=1 Tax=Araneus ventricosus TaxID=182803 RepID=A0A4Y2G1K1_ARAVE|nr:hypothetical protein AVEN_78890-1 [Araneus ventricosus]
MKRQNIVDVTNPAGSGQIDGNLAGSDRIEIGAGLQSLHTSGGFCPPHPPTYYLTCNRPTYTGDLQWNRVLNLEPCDPEAKTQTR